MEWDQSDLADKSGVSLPTIKRLEAAGGDLGGLPETVDKVRAALERAGIVFLNGGEPGVRLRKKK